MLTYLTFHGKNKTNQNQKAKTKEKSKKILDLETGDWRLETGHEAFALWPTAVGYWIERQDK
jgi:hypothetical protein